MVAPVDSILEVEEWVGEWWEPSSVTLTAACNAPPVPPSVFIAQGVPPIDRVAEPRPSADAFQALMHVAAPESQSFEPPGSRPLRPFQL